MKDSEMLLIESLCGIIENRDFANDWHCDHIRRFTEIMLDKVVKYCPEYQLTAKDCQDIVLASAMHDIGMISVPDRILQKPGRLTYDEFQIVKNHTRKGKKIFDGLLKKIDSSDPHYSLYRFCSDICMYHHERFDGEGYPEKLKGNDIPIAAQIVGLADVYDSLLSEKLYKPAYSKEEAFEMILEGECGVFSVRLLEIFSMVRMELEEIADDKSKE
jgi:putative two-component system response regulator